MQQTPQENRFAHTDYHKKWMEGRKKTMAESTPISYEEMCENLQMHTKISRKDVLQKTTRLDNVTIEDQQGEDSDETDVQRKQVRAQRIPQEVDRESRTDYGRKYADFLRRSVREHADWYSAFKEGRITKEELKFREEELLAQEAERNGDILPSSAFDRAHRQLVKDVGYNNAGGGENVNALDVVDGVTYVIKRNNLSYSNSYSEFFNKIAVHNYLFPDTEYEFLGLMYDNNVNRGPGYKVALQPVFRQRFVERSRKSTEADIDATMASIGFGKLSYGRFIDKTRGIVVTDLTTNNVLIDGNGYVAVIDPFIEVTEKYWSN